MDESPVEEPILCMLCLYQESPEPEPAAVAVPLAEDVSLTVCRWHLVDLLEEATGYKVRRTIEAWDRMARIGAQLREENRAAKAKRRRIQDVQGR